MREIPQPEIVVASIEAFSVLQRDTRLIRVSNRDWNLELFDTANCDERVRIRRALLRLPRDKA